MAQRRTPRTSRAAVPMAKRRRLQIIAGLMGLAGFAVVVSVIAVMALQRSFAVDPGDANLPELTLGSRSQPGSAALPAMPELTSGPLDYVALGDSFAAGPGLTPVRDDPRACERTRDNYPAYLAQLLEVQTYRDVSCTGARPRDIEGSQRRPDGTQVRPQSQALGPETDLVTLSLGGNELSSLQMAIDACYVRATARPADPPCDQTFKAEGDEPILRAGAIEDAVVDSLRQVRNAAPQATVVLVSYPYVFPTRRTCPELVVSSSESAYLAQVLETIVDSTERAARSAGVRFIDLRRASAGHEICSDAAWSIGPGAPDGSPRAWHPTRLGMQSMAQWVASELTGELTTRPRGRARPPASATIANAVS